jgi:hypothetical protein
MGNFPLAYFIELSISLISINYAKKLFSFAAIDLLRLVR